jgi:hypothetical protein
MNPELAPIVVILAFLLLLDVAAMRWGVDSRFRDVRSGL